MVKQFNTCFLNRIFSIYIVFNFWHSIDFTLTFCRVLIPVVWVTFCFSFFVFVFDKSLWSYDF